MKINEKLFSYFENAGRKISYKAREIIYMQEENAESLFLIVKGRVRVYSISPAGEEITLEILEKGRIFGESSFFQNSLRPTTVEAVNDVELISCVIAELYRYFRESEELMTAVFRHLIRTCDHVTYLLKMSYLYDRYQKIASFLLYQTKTDDIEKGIINNTIPYTHEEVAACLGLSRVTVTKVLREFSQKGYIENRYKKIRVIERNKLMELVENRSSTMNNHK